MKLGISDKGLRRIARSLQGMPFLADPPIPQSEVYQGVIEFPGFHTTDSFDIASAYALGRIGQSYTEEANDDSHYVTDYPVVVQVDMETFTPETDYDAEEMVKPHLSEAFFALEDEGITVDSEDDEIIEAAYQLSEYADTESDIEPGTVDPMSYISESVFYHFKNPMGGLTDDPNFPNWVRTYLSTGEMDPQMLMKATDQYRYVDDVDEEHVKAIWYLQPVAQEIYNYDAEDANEEEFERRWPGFDIPDIDQMYGGYYSANEQLVYGSSQEGGQYHGTTYKRLLQAAPGLAGQLPAPPSPPYQG